MISMAIVGVVGGSGCDHLGLGQPLYHQVGESPVKTAATQMTTTASNKTEPARYTLESDRVNHHLLYVIASNSQYAPSHTLFVSQDAGITWDTVTTPLGSDIDRVDFQNANDGVVYGVEGAQFNQIALYRTVDGGKHWSISSLPATLTRSATRYGAPFVAFASNSGKLSWLFATWDDTQFPKWGIYHSRDGGKTWTGSNVSIGPLSSGEIVVVHALNEKIAYFVKFCPKCAAGDTTGTNLLEITHDGGRIWTRILLPFTGPNQVQKLTFTTSKSGTAIVQNAMTDHSTEYRTNNGGYSWSRV